MPAATWLSHIKSSLSHLVVFDLIERSSLSIKLRSETQHILPSNLSLTVRDRFRLTSEVMENRLTDVRPLLVQRNEGLSCRQGCHTDAVGHGTNGVRPPASPVVLQLTDTLTLLAVSYVLNIVRPPHERSCVSQALFVRQCGHKFAALNKGIVLYQTHSTA